MCLVCLSIRQPSCHNSSHPTTHRSAAVAFINWKSRYSNYHLQRGQWLALIGWEKEWDAGRGSLHPVWCSCLFQIGTVREKVWMAPLQVWSHVETWVMKWWDSYKCAGERLFSHTVDVVVFHQLLVAFSGPGKFTSVGFMFPLPYHPFLSHILTVSQASNQTSSITPKLTSRCNDSQGEAYELSRRLLQTPKNRHKHTDTCASLSLPL